MTFLKNVKILIIWQISQTIKTGPIINSMNRSFSYMGAKVWNQHLNDKL